ncbi:hypothetical protein [Micromonospora sp. IBSANI012]
MSWRRVPAGPTGVRAGTALRSAPSVAVAERATAVVARAGAFVAA